MTPWNGRTKCDGSSKSEHIWLNRMEIGKDDFQLTHNYYMNTAIKSTSTILYFHGSLYLSSALVASFLCHLLSLFYSFFFFFFHLLWTDDSCRKQLLRQIKRDSLFVCAFFIRFCFGHYNCVIKIDECSDDFIAQSNDLQQI